MKELVLETHGLRIAVRSNSAMLLEQVRSRTASVAAPSSGTPQLSYTIEERRERSGLSYAIRCGQCRMEQSTTPREALDALLRRMQLHVAEEAPEHVFVHAGVVSWQGKAILLPGRTFSGKTSLVVALLRQGAVYYSDEYAVLDRCGMVHPYARPLQVRMANGSRLWTAHMLGAEVGSEPLDVALVVFAKYQVTSCWQARPVSPGNAMLRLLANTVCARKRPHQALACLRLVALKAPAFLAVRGECGDAVKPVLDLLAKDRKAEGSYESHCD